MVKSIIFKITEAGKFAALSANEDTAQLKVNLVKVAVGTGKYTVTGNETALQNKIKESEIVSGDVEVESNTLRFSASMAADAITPIYEVGLITDDGVLFAVASSTTEPLLSLYPNVMFVMAFGLSLNDIEARNITVTTDPNGAIAVIIMQQHLAARDPHPQYLNINRFQMLMNMLVTFGYLHHSHNDQNPKPIFDELLGIPTFWRRITGKIILATDPNNRNIDAYGITVGQHGVTEVSLEPPHVYPLRTTHIWERYDPEAPLIYNGEAVYDGSYNYR